MNEYYSLASCEQIFYGPFKCILASFILVNSNCDQAIATNLSSSITSLWIWKMHFVIHKAVSQIISNFGSLSFLEKSIFIFFQKFSAYCQRVSGAWILETIYQRIGSTNGSPKISQFLVKISGQIGGSNTCPSVPCAHFLPLVLWVIGAHKCAKVGKEIWIGNDKYLPVRLAYFYCG